MFFEIFIAVLLGIIAGIITGLLPGIHINLVATTLLSSSAFFLGFASAIALVCFLVSMSIVHTFLDMIPSIFLGVPDDTALSVLPGHSMLLDGRGYEAIKLTAMGSFFALFIIILISPLYVLFLPSYYEYFVEYIAPILIVISLFLILSEGRGKKILAFLLFILAGVLGIATLNYTLIKQPLFPLLTGLFGTPLLIMSILHKSKIPKQRISSGKKVHKGYFKALAASILSGSLVSFLPGLGAAQGAVVGKSIAGKLGRKSFLILLGAISTITIGLGFVALYAISRPRHGVAVAVGKLLEAFTLNQLMLLLAVMLFSGSIAFLLTLFFARVFAKEIMKVNYRKLSLGIITLLAVLTVIISGFYGLLILITGTSIGLLASFWQIRKMHLMGCLILPVILFFLI